MANIDAAIKKLEMLKSEYQDAIDHDETILVSTMFVLLRGVLQAMREPVTLVESCLITREQAEKILDQNKIINRRINDLEARFGTTNLKPRIKIEIEKIQRRFADIEEKLSPIPKQDSAQFRNEKLPEQSGEIICLKCGIRYQSADGNNCGKRTIEIDRDVAEGWLKDIVSTGAFENEVRRALEAE